MPLKNLADAIEIWHTKYWDFVYIKQGSVYCFCMVCARCMPPYMQELKSQETVFSQASYLGLHTNKTENGTTPGHGPDCELHKTPGVIHVVQLICLCVCLHVCV